MDDKCAKCGGETILGLNERWCKAECDLAETRPTRVIEDAPRAEMRMLAVTGTVSIGPTTQNSTPFARVLVGEARAWPSGVVGAGVAEALTSEATTWHLFGQHLLGCGWSRAMIKTAKMAAAYGMNADRFAAMYAGDFMWPSKTEAYVAKEYAAAITESHALLGRPITAPVAWRHLTEPPINAYSQALAPLPEIGSRYVATHDHITAGDLLFLGKDVVPIPHVEGFRYEEIVTVVSVNRMLDRNEAWACVRAHGCHVYVTTGNDFSTFDVNRRVALYVRDPDTISDDYTPTYKLRKIPGLS